MDKLLTIVIPVYNTEKYLARCLESLIVPQYLNQLEVLIVIDGSPDNSEAIAREYHNKYPQTFFVVEKENGGHGSAINLGIHLAKGLYFRVLDSDDWFDSNNFELFLNRLRHEDSNLILTHIACEYPSSGKSYLWNREKIDYDINCNMSMLSYVSFNFFLMGRCTYKTAHLKENGLELLNKRSFEDTFLHIFPLIFVESFIFYDLIIYHYYLERPDQSVRQKNSFKQCSDWRAVIEQMANFYSQHIDIWEQDGEKKQYVLRVLKQHINDLYIIMDDLPYKATKKELQSFNKYVRSLPFYSMVKGINSRYYNFVPFPIFRASHYIYAFIRKKIYQLSH